jgi:hypothetical protein
VDEPTTKEEPASAASSETGNKFSKMSDDDLDKLVNNAIKRDVSDAEWQPIEAELERRKALYDENNMDLQSDDIEDMLVRLKSELDDSSLKGQTMNWQVNAKDKSAVKIKVKVVGEPEEGTDGKKYVDVRREGGSQTFKAEMGELQSIGESINEAALSKKNVQNIFRSAAQYAFRHNVMDRPEYRTGNRSYRADPDRRGNQSASAYSRSSSADDDSSTGSGGVYNYNKINAFLRLHDIDNEILASLRETARAARGLGSFRGAHDHKILALIGLAFIKYRD